MAKSLDNYTDVKELDSYTDLLELELDSIDDELTSTFLKAANHLQTLLATVDNATLLLLYGYYKQATEGHCNIPQPSWYDMRAKQKWEAWNKLGDLDKNKAKASYITIIQKIDPNFLNVTTAKESWITVSTLQAQDEVLSESEKSLVDYVKENNCSQVCKILKTYDNSELEEILAELDSEGLGLIHWATDHGFTEMIELLLSLGANVNLEDSEKQTPLHFASSCSHLTCVEVLLKHGADVKAEDVHGQTSLSVSSDDAIRNLLINHD